MPYRHQEALDFAPLMPATFGWLNQPPCNGPVLAIAAVGLQLAGTVMGFVGAQNAAKQSELNAKAQADAITQEQNRRAIEEQENRKRLIMQQREQRARQLAALGSTGAMLGTGTPLDIEADTWAKQQVQLGDREYSHQLGQRELAYGATSALAMGASQARQYRAEGIGNAISGLGQAAGNAYGMWTTRPQPFGAN